MNCPKCNGNGELECTKCKGEKSKKQGNSSCQCYNGIVICPTCSGNGTIE
ncbi:DnaJ-class molecular chaperone [Scopulibacillus daqui]|uniref:DnaJ-class molecular chaperone n=1 Tax=Scopulibacillus daqui TaxID=1469162 RepID=A0ABS2PW31_9BACL|nr:hypothetical protein [Scopulibacillus daqui]MBM7644278.1 DnaJ-class molecular chaperone [Scopulibacillus daqui]